MDYYLHGQYLHKEQSIIPKRAKIRRLSIEASQQTSNTNKTQLGRRVHQEEEASVSPNKICCLSAEVGKQGNGRGSMSQSRMDPGDTFLPEASQHAVDTGKTPPGHHIHLGGEVLSRPVEIHHLCAEARKKPMPGSSQAPSCKMQTWRAKHTPALRRKIVAKQEPASKDGQAVASTPSQGSWLLFQESHHRRDTRKLTLGHHALEEDISGNVAKRYRISVEASKQPKPGSSQAPSCKMPTRRAKHTPALRRKIVAKQEPASRNVQAGQEAPSQGLWLPLQAWVTPDPSPGMSGRGTSRRIEELPRPLEKLNRDSGEAAVSGKQLGQAETPAKKEPAFMDGQAVKPAPSQGSPKVQERRARRDICLLPWVHFRAACRESLAKSPQTSTEGSPKVQERRARRDICLLPCVHFTACRGSLAESHQTSAEACLFPDPSPRMSGRGTSRRTNELPCSLEESAGTVWSPGEAKASEKGMVQYVLESLQKIPGKNFVAWHSVRKLLSLTLKKILGAVLRHFPHPTGNIDWDPQPPAPPRIWSVGHQVWRSRCGGLHSVGRREQL
ncbi:uncharacterized protein LOC112551341 [Alligator sinensis]|uniref:Uncharacterized protein LOC112551341 n=1 Tax=Alligator sinensis TaxID=38654 RepID=A0A3Q0HB12_ALLSI|nr:uncharacterized protein LOC112551341 [Alligator sinensis]